MWGHRGHDLPMEEARKIMVMIATATTTRTVMLILPPGVSKIICYGLDLEYPQKPHVLRSRALGKLLDKGRYTLQRLIHG